MAIYVYDGTQKTPKNYIGVRVAVSINGKLHQKWFKGETDTTEAKTIERQWKFEQQLYRSKKSRERKEPAKNSAYVTGVAGIKMKFIVNISRRKSISRSYTPVFLVSGSTNSQRFQKRFNIKRLGFDLAWLKACQYASEKYGQTLFDKMLIKKPSVRQFHIIYRWQRKQGHDIPKHRLPNELLISD
ncbi:MAG: hypothetical protein KAG28_04330 [Cocleimonas sp.]|nr:hypothetical protein [Cocleimonas sp.]